MIQKVIKFNTNYLLIFWYCIWLNVWFCTFVFFVSPSEHQKWDWKFGFQVSQEMDVSRRILTCHHSSNFSNTTWRELLQVIILRISSGVFESNSTWHDMTNKKSCWVELMDWLSWENWKIIQKPNTQFLNNKQDYKQDNLF